MHPTIIRRYAASQVPPISEAQATERMATIILEVAESFIPDYTFGSYTADDIRQEAAKAACQALARDPDTQRSYDPARPLANFLYVHMKRRLRNLKRDQFMRPEAPCTCCGDPFNPPAEPCVHWHRWSKRNTAKRNLAGAGSATPPREVAAATRADDETLREVDEFVNEAFSHHLRADYLRIRSGASLPRERREAVLAKLRARFGGAA